MNSLAHLNLGSDEEPACFIVSVYRVGCSGVGVSGGGGVCGDAMFSIKKYIYKRIYRQNALL